MPGRPWAPEGRIAVNGILPKSNIEMVFASLSCPIVEGDAFGRLSHSAHFHIPLLALVTVTITPLPTLVMVITLSLSASTFSLVITS